MTHYVAIVEEEEGKAVGVWFPDLPGCVSAGDTLDEAMTNAAEALQLWAEAMIENGRKIPPARSLTELKADPEVGEDLRRFMVALIAFPADLQHAAEWPLARA
jgi:predicted RNase H-like HicB family nuclease